jgi:hypothetical protein
MRTMDVAGESFDIDRAKQVIAGYCFDEVDLAWDPPHERYGEVPPTSRRRRWGYATYEGTRSPGDRLALDDLLAPVSLNVVRGFGVEMLSRLLVVGPMVSEVVANVSEGFAFWHLNPQEVSPRSTPIEGSDAWLLHRAWFLMNCVPSVGPTISHKILHHRWPDLFPVVDKRTRSVLGRNDYWGRILDDLRRKEKEWAALEDWFRALPLRNNEPTLTRLRLHDILLWCRVVDQEEEAARAGERLLITI